MRVLLLSSAERAAASTRLFAHLGAGLAERGAEVAYLVSPHAEIRSLLGAIGDAAASYVLASPRWIGQFVDVRRTVQRFNPDVVLVDSEHDALIAAIAARRRAGVVRRLRPLQDADWTWRSHLAMRLSQLAVIAPTAGDTHTLPRTARVVRAPVALPAVSRPTLQIASDILPAPPRIACVPGSGSATALCLRAFARLHNRRRELRLVLFGDPARMQPVRVHAAALGLTDFVDTLPESVLYSSRQLDFAAVWIARDGDDGTIASVAAMVHGLPVIVARDSDVSALVAHRITGLHVDENDFAASVASIAHWLEDAASFHSMCDATLARVHRVHSWATYLDRLVEAVEIARPARRAVRNAPAGAARA